MSALPPPAAPATQEDVAAAHYRAFLDDLIAMGTDLARQIHAQVTARPAATLEDRQAAFEATVAATVAFDRAARAVRRTILLARHLQQPPAAAPVPGRVAARKRIIREVEDAIAVSRRLAPKDTDPEALGNELLERLDAPDLEDDIAGRPVAAVIADICRDLGLASIPNARVWKRRTPGDVEALCARAAAPPGTLHVLPRRPGPAPIQVAPATVQMAPATTQAAPAAPAVSLARDG